MKRREFIKAAGVGLAASAVAAPAVAQSMPEIKWRLTAGWPKSLDTMYGACEFFAKRLAEVSDNRFQVQVFAGGEIVPGLQVLDAVQKGTVEMGHTSMLTYFGKDPAFTFGTGLPFGLNTRQQEAWLIHGGGNEMLGDLLKNYNCWGVPGGNTTCQMGGWFRKEINTVGDLQGLKMRIGGLGGRIIQKLGVVAQQIASGDIYPSLEKGTIDAAEWVGPHDDEKLGFSKVAKFYYYPGWWDGCANQHFLVNMTKWNELPKNYQAMIQACAREAAAWKTSRYDALNPAALRRLLEAGVVLKPFPQEVMEACWRSANELYSDLNKTNSAFKKMYDSMMAYKNDSYTWFQVAELAYDSFQMRMRGKN